MKVRIAYIFLCGVILVALLFVWAGYLSRRSAMMKRVKIAHELFVEGCVLLEKRDFDEAAKRFEEVLLHRPEWNTARDYLARSLARTHVVTQIVEAADMDEAYASKGMGERMSYISKLIGDKQFDLARSQALLLTDESARSSAMGRINRSYWLYTNRCPDTIRRFLTEQGEVFDRDTEDCEREAKGLPSRSSCQ